MVSVLASGVVSEMVGAEIDPAVMFPDEPLVVTLKLPLADPPTVPETDPCVTCTAPPEELKDTPVPERAPLLPVTITPDGAVTDKVPVELKVPGLLTVAAFTVKLPAEVTALVVPTIFKAPDEPDAEASNVTGPPVNCMLPG